MAFSAVVTAVFTVLICISRMRASVIRASDVGLKTKTENFNVRITEKEANFVEQVEIDTDNDIEYFSVPGHNDVVAADFLFDFRMNITLTRFKDRRSCVLTPLPSDLARPNQLKKGLEEMAALPPAHQIRTEHHKWEIGGLVDKATLRPEVRDFCSQYPVRRLYKYPGLADTSDVETELLKRRARRQIDFSDFDLCGSQVPPKCGNKPWILRCKFTTSHCVYYLTCKQNVRTKLNYCDQTPIHFSGTLMCCEARCSS